MMQSLNVNTADSHYGRVGYENINTMQSKNLYSDRLQDRLHDRIQQLNLPNAFPKGRVPGAKNYAANENDIILESIMRRKAFHYWDNTEVWKEIAAEVSHATSNERSPLQINEHFKKMIGAVRFGISEIYAKSKLSWPVKSTPQQTEDQLHKDRSEYVTQLLNLMTAKGASKKYYSRNWWSQHILYQLLELIAADDRQDSGSITHFVDTCYASGNIGTSNRYNQINQTSHNLNMDNNNVLGFSMNNGKHILDDTILKPISNADYDDSLLGQTSSPLNTHQSYGNKRKLDEDADADDTSASQSLSNVIVAIDREKLASIDNNILFTKQLAENMSQGFSQTSSYEKQLENRLKHLELIVNDLRIELREALDAVRSIRLSYPLVHHQHPFIQPTYHHHVTPNQLLHQQSMPLNQQSLQHHQNSHAMTMSYQPSAIHQQHAHLSSSQLVARQHQQGNHQQQSPSQHLQQMQTVASHMGVNSSNSGLIANDEVSQHSYQDNEDIDEDDYSRQ